MTTPTAPAADEQLQPLRINWDVLFVVALFLGFFALYARTAAPGVLDGDFGEFQTNIFKLGVSHTGYPLYFLLAKLWTVIMPAGTIAYRANTFSGLCGALTLVLIYGMMRTLTQRKLVALVTAALFGVSRVQWSQAVIPDVYTLNSLLLVLVLWFAILWRIGRVPLWWVSLAYGLALTHHRTSLLLAPALLLFVLVGAGKSLLNLRLLAVNAAALLLPLLLYLYIPLRGESDVGVGYHAQNFTDMILASNVSVWLRFGPPGFLWERITQVYLPLLIEQFTPVGFVVGWLGIGALAFGRVPRGFPAALPPRQLLLLLGLAHLAATAFAVTFWVVDSEIFFIPSYLTFLFFVGIGLACALDFLAARVPVPNLSRAVRGLVMFGALALCLWLAWGNFARNDQSNNDEADARWQEILAQPLEANATIMSTWEDLTPLEYYQFVQGRRTDLQRDKIIIYRDQLRLVPQGNLLPAVRQGLSEGKAYYMTRHPADTETLGKFDQLELVPFASLWRLALPFRAAVPTENPGDELRGILVAPSTPHAGDFVTAHLNWSPDAPLANTRLRLTLRDAAGMTWLTHESLPFGGRPAESAEANANDPQGFFIPPDAPPGEYVLELDAFERESQAGLPLIGDSNRITRTLTVAPATAATPPEIVEIPRPLDVALGGAHLLGFGVIGDPLRGGDRMEVDTWWQGLADGRGDYALTLTDAADVTTTLYQGALFSEAAGAFNPAQIVRARHALTLPPTAAPGYAALAITFAGETHTIHIPLEASNRRFDAPKVPHPQLTQVGASMQLLGYALDRAEFRPGDAVPLTLYWKAKATPSASYKVFVHLLDSGGNLRAQRDSIPQDGALPTNRWFPGEYITDAYSIPLPADLAPGEYRLTVGMYDERSGARVPLTDSNGVPLPDNRVFLDDSIQVR